MRNLKKILALVLALVMSMSMLATANAFEDSKDIDGKFDEAVTVLNALGVFQGYDNGKTFQPKGEITRAEVAAIIYRIVTGDVADNQVKIYKDYNKFDDVKFDKWYAGYVNFCANAEIIKGYSDTKFGPNDTVTGYQALAMILRAIGYDKNGEFTGAGWQVQTAAVAKKLNVTKNITAGTLGTAATREMVAEILFRTIAYAKQVDYTLAFGYTEYGNKTLGEETFKLACDEESQSVDKWGRPGYYWYAYGAPLCAIKEAPKATYTTAVAECEVAADYGFDGSKSFALYVNGVVTSDVLQATDTVATIGAQGRLTEVYANRIVMIDTFLAHVDNIKDATYDARGHLKTPATITLTVYDNAAGNVYTQTRADVNYDEYTVGDMILLNAYTNAGNRNMSTTISNTTGVFTYVELGNVADAINGTQTVIWFNTGKHTVNSTTYDDAYKFLHDEAGDKINNYTWFFDEYDNLIGSFEIAAQYDYAVLTSIWWAGDATNGAGSAMGTLKYMDGSDNTVTVASIEGHTPVYASNIGADVMKLMSDNTIQISTNAATNATYDNVVSNDDLIHGHLYKVATLANGSVALAKVNDGAAVPAHTEKNNGVSIINKYAYITTPNQGNVKTDINTLFLVRGSLETSEYKTYIGINELPSFKAGAVVDYVLAANGVAKYVYIIGETVDSNSNDFVLIMDRAYSAILKTAANGVSYWELTLPVPAEDGSVVTLKVLDDDGSYATVPAVVQTLTNINNVGKLFYVAYTNGYAVSATQVTVTPFVYSTDGRAIQLNQNATFDGGVIEMAGTAYRFNVTKATTVVGKLALDMTDKVVYVIYDKNDNNASKVYILDIEEGTGPVTPAIPGLFVDIKTNPSDVKVTWTGYGEKGPDISDILVAIDAEITKAGNTIVAKNYDATTNSYTFTAKNNKTGFTIEYVYTGTSNAVVAPQPTTPDQVDKMMDGNYFPNFPCDKFSEIITLGLTQTLVDGETVALTGKLTAINEANFAQYQAGVEQYIAANAGIADWDAMVTEIERQGFDMDGVTDIAFVIMAPSTTNIVTPTMVVNQNGVLRCLKNATQSLEWADFTWDFSGLSF